MIWFTLLKSTKETTSKTAYWWILELRGKKHSNVLIVVTIMQKIRPDSAYWIKNPVFLKWKTSKFYQFSSTIVRNYSSVSFVIKSFHKRQHWKKAKKDTSVQDKLTKGLTVQVSCLGLQLWIMIVPFLFILNSLLVHL